MYHPQWQEEPNVVVICGHTHKIGWNNAVTAENCKPAQDLTSKPKRGMNREKTTSLKRIAFGVKRQPDVCHVHAKTQLPCFSW